MDWLNRSLARLVRDRGLVATWQLACLAAIAPYVLAPMLAMSSGRQGPDAWPLAISLAFTLFLLSCLRTTLDQFQSTGMAILRRPAGSDDTLATSRPAPQMRGRDELVAAIDTHLAADGRAAIGILGFANYPAMAAFSAVAAHRVLAAFEQRLEAATGSKRLAARIDSHTFGVWFPDGEAAELASELAAIGHLLSQDIADEELTVSPDIHASLAWLRGEGEPALAVIARAQAQLAPLKRFIQGETPRASSAPVPLAERFAMEQSLRRAVRNGQLYLHYQPFVDVSTGRVSGAEALLRWRHPDLGHVSPSRFVPLLEETGLIHEIGLWTLNTACRQLSIWRAAAGAEDLRLAVNLSAVQLQDRALRPLIERTVAAHGLAPADLELELTETAAMEDQDRTLALFQELRAKGFGIAIDDFGNGHSNLSYLKNLPFTKLKIDRDFVTEVHQRPGSQAICKALVELAGGLGISVLAEGVERIEEVHALHRLGCNVFQGFYFARGMAAEDLSAKLVDPQWLDLIASSVHRQRAELQKRMML